jgi:cytochrome b involved in lipid metabolism
MRALALNLLVPIFLALPQNSYGQQYNETVMACIAVAEKRIHDAAAGDVQLNCNSLLSAIGYSVTSKASTQQAVASTTASLPSLEPVTTLDTTGTKLSSTFQQPTVIPQTTAVSSSATTQSSSIPQTITASWSPTIVSIPQLTTVQASTIIRQPTATPQPTTSQLSLIQEESSVIVQTTVNPPAAVSQQLITSQSPLTTLASSFPINLIPQTTCQPYPSELISILSSSLRACDQMGYLTLAQLPSGNTASSPLYAPTTLQDRALIEAAPTGLVTSKVTYKRSLTCTRREANQTPSPVTIYVTLQSISANSGLHQEPEPKTSSPQSITPSTIQTATTSSTLPLSSTSSPKKSGAHNTKMPPMSLLLACVLFALFITPALGQTPCLATSELAKHNTKTDAWIIYQNNGEKVLPFSRKKLIFKVYNVTGYLDIHPGGANAITPDAGQDATTDFDGVGHSPDALATMQKYLLGPVGGACSGAASSSSQPASSTTPVSSSSTFSNSPSSIAVAPVSSSQNPTDNPSSTISVAPVSSSTISVATAISSQTSTNNPSSTLSVAPVSSFQTSTDNPSSALSVAPANGSQTSIDNPSTIFEVLVGSSEVLINNLGATLSVAPVGGIQTSTDNPGSTLVSDLTVRNITALSEQPSSTPQMHSMTPCANNPKFLCVGSMTAGSFTGSPTAPATTEFRNGHSTVTSSYASSITPGSVITSSATTSSDKGLSTATSSLASFISPVSVAINPVASMQSDSSTPFTAAASSPPITQTAPEPSTSWVVLTTTGPEITIHSSTVITESAIPTASLQNVGISGRRPPVVFSVLARLLAFSSTAWAGWSVPELTTKPPPLEVEFCTQDPTYGCVNGTPMSVVLLLDSVAKTSTSKSEATPTPCTEDPQNGCISMTPVSDFWIAAPIATLPSLSFTVSLPSSPVPTGIASGSPVSLPQHPTPCSTAISMLCMGTTVVGPTPCVWNPKEVCVGTVIVESNFGGGGTLMPTLTLGGPTESTQLPLSGNITSMSISSSPPSLTESITLLLSESITTISNPSSTPSLTGSVSPSLSKSSMSMASATATHKSFGLSNKNPPRIFRIFCILFGLRPNNVHAATPLTTSAPQIGAISTTATPCTSDPVYGCVGKIPVTDIAPPFAKPSACPDQTTASCLGGIVLYGTSKQGDTESTSESSESQTRIQQFSSTSTSTVISSTSVAITTVGASSISATHTSDMESELLRGRTWGIIFGIWVGGMLMNWFWA